MREARIHVRHVRDILKSLEMADAYNGVDCNSLSFLNVVTQGDLLGMHFNYSNDSSVDCYVLIYRKKKNSIRKCGLYSSRLYNAKQ